MTTIRFPRTPKREPGYLGALQANRAGELAHVSQSVLAQVRTLAPAYHAPLLRHLDRCSAPLEEPERSRWVLEQLSERVLARYPDLEK